MCYIKIKNISTVYLKCTNSFNYGSYYMFIATLQLSWWKAAKKDEEIGVPIENEEFVEKYRKTFVDKLRMPKTKLNNPDKAIIMVARDCPREDIWRSNCSRITR